MNEEYFVKFSKREIELVNCIRRMRRDWEERVSEGLGGTKELREEIRNCEEVLGSWIARKWVDDIPF